MFIPPIKKVILGMVYEIMLPTLMVVTIMVNVYISAGTSPFFLGLNKTCFMEKCHCFTHINPG